MADVITTRITGLTKTLSKFGRIPKILLDELEEEFGVLVLRIEAKAKSLVPRKSGNLFRTIASEVERDLFNVKGLVGANTVYAKRQELDTTFRHRSRKGFIGKPTPYLFPALKANLIRVNRGIINAVRKAAKRGAM